MKKIPENVLRNMGLCSLRAGLGFVFSFFGLDQLLHPSSWMMFIPSVLAKFFLQYPWFNPHYFLFSLGITEIFLGGQLFLGILTRFSAFVAAVILVLIIQSVGLDTIGIRDLGLLSCAIGILFLGPGDWSIDEYLQKTNKSSPSEKKA